ncbi:MAG: type VI secretion system tube protein TssD [Prevotella sp.]
MNNSATLQFGDNVTGIYSKEYLVVECRTKVNRTHNNFHPDSAPRCDSIEVTIVAPKKSDTQLYEWYISNGKSSGCVKYSIVIITNTKFISKERFFMFEGGQCFSLKEKFDIKEPNRKLLTMLITADSIKVDDVTIGKETEDF